MSDLLGGSAVRSRLGEMTANGAERKLDSHVGSFRFAPKADTWTCHTAGALAYRGAPVPTRHANGLNASINGDLGAATARAPEERRRKRF
jgi:hypothetical protein